MERKANEPAPSNVTRYRAAPPRPPRQTVSAREYFLRKMGGTLQQAHVDTRIGYSTLWQHVMRGRPIQRKDIALRLQEWSGGVISAAKTLGLE